MTRTALIWVAFGVAGIAFAVGIGIAAAEISSERIGLSSEPLSAGEDLAPDALGNGGRADGGPTSTAPPTEEQIKGGEEAAEETQEAAEEAKEEAEDAAEDALNHDESDEDD